MPALSGEDGISIPNDILDTDFTENDILKAVKKLTSEKSPGLDGVIKLVLS